LFRAGINTKANLANQPTVAVGIAPTNLPDLDARPPREFRVRRRLGLRCFTRTWSATELRTVFLDPTRTHAKRLISFRGLRICYCRSMVSRRGTVEPDAGAKTPPRAAGGPGSNFNAIDVTMFRVGLTLEMGTYYE
jgi:hypothetical protein